MEGALPHLRSGAGGLPFLYLQGGSDALHESGSSRRPTDESSVKKADQAGRKIDEGFSATSSPRITAHKSASHLSRSLKL